MNYKKSIILKDGTECCLRNATCKDAEGILENFNLTHRQTDYLLSYPDESNFSLEQEIEFLNDKNDNPKEILIAALIEGKVVGTAGIETVGKNYKVLHRVSFGIGIDKAYWGLGIGKQLTKTCIECAREAGHTQLELEVVSENTHAISMYKKTDLLNTGGIPEASIRVYPDFRNLYTCCWSFKDEVFCTANMGKLFFT